VALLTLREAAAQLGITADTLRAQVRRGRLSATKLGRDWVVETAEVARYERTSLGRQGRPPRGSRAAIRSGSGAER
jgi:excisionase family DNA binding protein